MTGAPQVLEAYKMLCKLFQDSSLTNEELKVVWQIINIEHNCHYCVPVHTGVAHKMNIDESLISNF